MSDETEARIAALETEVAEARGRIRRNAEQMEVDYHRIKLAQENVDLFLRQRDAANHQANAARAALETERATVALAVEGLKAVTAQMEGVQYNRDKAAPETDEWAQRAWQMHGAAHNALADLPASATALCPKGGAHEFVGPGTYPGQMSRCLKCRQIAQRPGSDGAGEEGRDG